MSLSQIIIFITQREISKHIYIVMKK